MQMKSLGKSDLQISPLGLGTWAIAGSGWDFAWGPQDDKESIATIHAAVERGINWIDTAAVYGLGHAEELVGKALRGLPPSRRPYVFTKCTLVWDERGRVSHSLESASIRREIETSLQRLDVDVIDLYQIHWPAFPHHPSVGTIEEAIGTLAELRLEGKIRHIGVSNFDVEQTRRARAAAPIAALQPPYSMLMPGIEADILPYCQAENIGVIVYSPLQSGLLSGSMTRQRIAALPENDWRKTRSADYREPRLTQNLALVEQLRAIGARHGRTPAEVALAWVLRKPVVTGAIVGARRPAQLYGLMGAFELRLTESEIQEIAVKVPQDPSSSVPEPVERAAR
jgi:aryl-alcohol dehydrogenase-like predicted oxidoreductase